MEVELDELVVEESIDHHDIQVFFQCPVEDYRIEVFLDVLDNERHDMLDAGTCFNDIQHCIIADYCSRT